MTSRYNQTVTRPVPLRKRNPSQISKRLTRFSAMPGWCAIVAASPPGLRGSFAWNGLCRRNCRQGRLRRGLQSNGVEWLPVPGWEKMPWLWCGFSTRKGGGSRAYCAEGAAGELNLGFTAEDSREVVAGNRRLLAEAITGDAATPLVTLRQIHSNLVVRVGAADALRERPWKGRRPDDR